jgi:aminoglycoside 6'-N-acetyltransferase I
MAMSVRSADRRDVDEWLRMRRALWPQCPDAEHRDEIDAILAKTDGIETFVWVRDDGRLGGFLEATLRLGAEGCDSSPVGYIEGWYVDNDMRRRGVGGDFVRAAEVWARERGCAEMASDTEVENRLSQTAHEKLGYEAVERLVHFRKRLD